MKPKRFFFRSTALFGTPLRYGAPVFIGFTVLISGLSNSQAAIFGGSPSTSAGTGTTPAAGGASPTAPPVATDSARANTAALLFRTNQAVGAALALQNAARAAALASPSNNAGANPNQPGQTLPNVPNGLGAGGLQVAPGVGTDPSKWIGANLPIQALTGGKTEVTIKQTTQQALLSWQTLNVGKETTLKFDQSAGGANVGQWIAFNKISDPTGSPTQILGNIKADGQIYIINPNGIIFGGSSQVNARGLTVSSLPINDNLINRGLLNNPDAQFLFSGLAMPAGLNGTPSFTPEAPPATTGKYGDVVVQPGAKLESPTNSAKVGGRITLVGPNVTNQGTILTPDGQTILAAGLQVGFEGHSSSDPSLRGLDVFVGAVSDPTAGLYAGTVTQNGVVESQRGSITIAGRAIRQNGSLVTTTSVSLNGRIDVKANYNAVSNRATANSRGALFLFKDTGAVSLGENSIISILPEYASKETTIGTELALRSQVNISGKTVRLGAGSIVLAPNAIVNLSAGSWFFDSTSAAPTSTFVQTGGQVYLEDDAAIDVSGSAEVPVSVAQNIISVDLRSAELADSPLQRLGTLRNQTVEVDIRNTGNGWIGTPLADVSGFANLIQRSVGQLTTAGGSVTISAGGSVVMQPTSQITVSGGSTAFQGGMVRTTKLLTGGRLVDIGSASPDVVYDGIYDGSFTAANPKFQVSETYAAALIPAGYRYEAGYTQGAAGGKLSISAPSMALDGGLTGKTVVGDKQRSAPPAASTLSLAFIAQDLSFQNLPIHAPSPPTVIFDPNLTQAPAEPFALDANGNPIDLRADRKSLVALSPSILTAGGFGSLTLNNHDGDIIVPVGVELAAPTNGAISLTASNITINGTVSARGGSLSFSTFGLSYDQVNLIRELPPAATPPAVPTGRGIFTLAATGKINVSGMVVDDRGVKDAALVSPLSMAGGSVSILGYSANLAGGGLIDVSGGARINSRGVISYEKGGSLSITAGREPGFSTTLGGSLLLGSDMKGYSGAKASSLRVTGSAIQIGGSTVNPLVTLVDPERFAASGFGTISLSGVGIPGSSAEDAIPGVLVVAGTTVRPQVSGWLGSVGADDAFYLTPFLREETIRTPVQLSLSAIGASYAGVPIVIGSVVTEVGTSIITDAGGAVSIKGQTVSLAGSINSAGGAITIEAETSFPSAGVVFNALPTVHLSSTASLSTAGRQVLVADPFGLRSGKVFSGGNISVSGNLLAESGSIFDVSGASGILDLPPSNGVLEPLAGTIKQGDRSVPVVIHTDGGTITLGGSQMLFTDATLVGRAGGASANGGSLNVSSNRFVANGQAYTTADTNLTVKQQGNSIAATNTNPGVGNIVLDASGSPASQQGYFSVSSMDSGGFDSLNLGGNVRFQGDVSVQLPGRIAVSNGGIIYAEGKVNLIAGHVVIGQNFRTPSQQAETQLFSAGVGGNNSVTNFRFAPKTGSGSLDINAGLVDIGNLSLESIESASINASQGDIRGNGTFQMAGDLILKAGQIYPPTQREFKIFAYDSVFAGTPRKGSVTIRGGDSRSLPLSAGGTLSIYASQIQQGGALRAPFGTINLGWDGTGTTPFNPIAGATAVAPVTTLLTMASGGITSVSAIDPITRKETSIPYGISLDGKSWIDPAGNDITVSGPPAKAVNLAAQNLVTEADSIVDISGGGDLYAYRWISGNGGTEDVLASLDSFAVIPGYGFDYSPYAPFNNDSSATNLGGEKGYTNPSLKAGDKITLSASKNLPAGTYTLLPARYALLPGAILITPTATVPSGAVNSPDGSSIVSGYRSNNLDPARNGITLISGYEIAPVKVVRARAEYQDLFANTVLKEAAISREIAVPRLPRDAGYLSLSSTASMSLSGGVASLVAKDGRGSVIDINSSSNILINSSGSAGSGLVLSASTLNSFGAESLLIGGLRSFTPAGASVVANSSNVTLDNAGTALTGKDIILVSREKLTIEDDSEILTTEADIPLDDLTLGTAGIAGSGNGSLVRVSASNSGRVSRTSVSSSALPLLTLGAGVSLSGASIILDSTAGTKLAESALLNADDVSLSSGQISIALNNPGILNPGSGLILAGDALTSLQSSAKRLALASYSTLDVFGTGTVGSSTFESLSLQASAIRGFNTGNGRVTFRASSIALGNIAASTPPPPLATPLTGSLAFAADQITLGANSLRIEGFAESILAATRGILTSGQGSLNATGDLGFMAPLISGASASKYQITSAKSLQYSSLAANTLPLITGGLGADITLQGANVKVDSNIALPSGKLSIRATAGDLILGNTSSTQIDLAGTSAIFGDTIRYTSGGTLNLSSDSGAVTVASNASINVSAKAGGGNAGTIQVKAPAGVFGLTGSIIGTAGLTGDKGKFNLDAASILNGSLSALDATLNTGGFTQSRDYRIRSGNLNIDGPAISRIYRVSADSGNITVSNTINASGTTGGTIDLKANGSLVLTSSAVLDASASQFDSAGKGGAITLEAGNQRNGLVSSTALLDLKTGSSIKLGVAAADSNSNRLGKFTGTLHLRAPRNSNNSDMQIEAIGSSITGASSVLLEGVKLYGLTGSGVITTAIQNSIKSDSQAYLGAAGTTTAGYTAMLKRLSTLQPSPDLILAPGAEIFSLTGDIVLGTTTSTATSDWNLETYRFGPKSAAGVLTMRAKGDLVFYNALSDGFAAVTPSAANGQSSLWLAPLMANNPLLPDNTESWSYHFTSGADLTSADFRSTLSESSLTVDKGSFLLGKNYGNAASYGSGSNFTTATAISGRYQVIRTGSGDIEINAARNAFILNQFATVYTAGTLVADPTTVVNPGDFIVPLLLSSTGRHPNQGPALGAVQQRYFVQYSMAGGNVSVAAGEDIARLTRNSNSATGGTLIDDSSRQLPNNWLFRRGYIDPNTGKSGIAGVDDGSATLTDPDASTTWWVDFSNFFEGVGTLGGGNVKLTAGRDVKNIDALAPTNARMAGGVPSASKIVELGGGDVTISAARNIDGGVYYVERGKGVLSAGAEITTNSTRSPSGGIIESLSNPRILDEKTWLPTTFFVGKGGFSVQSAGSMLIGPAVNTFLLPQGLNNKYWYKTYFNTFGNDSYMDATSLGGDITLRNGATISAGGSGLPILAAWNSSQYYLSGANSPSSFQPWLRLAETEVTPFQTLSSIAAPRLSVSALRGNIDVVGDLTLFPSSTGQLELVSKESIIGLQPSGIAPGTTVDRWLTSTINLSDTDPLNVPGIQSPFAFLQVVGRAASAQRATDSLAGVGFLDEIDSRFEETASTNGVLQDEQKLHTSTTLHQADSEPMRIYALEGNIEGFTLFSPKQTRILAGNDIGDVAFYLQNTSLSAVSVVSAGRDITLYNQNTSSRIKSNSALIVDSTFVSRPLAGDVQIGGPGNLQVLAGRNLDLGLGSSNSDGTGTGITSIGNGRNPYLAFEGASITVGAGIGPARSLSTSSLAFSDFVAKYVKSEQGAIYLKEIAPEVVDFDALPEEEKARLALEIFYLNLRDTGRDYNNPDSPGYRKYDRGYDAIKTLFPESTSWDGEIITQSRDIRTRSGGDISIFAPGGGLTMANTTIGNPLTPPGIVTESGGSISIFTDQSVDIGIGRIFTLKGGDASIWSSKGDIAAGSSSRTVSAAPPTRVIIDPQSASVETDLAGLATGGGIGVLATVEGVEPGDVDLIAPTGVIDAGDAGIRVSGNINLAAVTVVNAGNISAGGTSTGAPVAAVAPSISTVSSASNASAASGTTVAKPGEEQKTRETTLDNNELLSLFTVEVIGYGGGGALEEDDKEREERLKEAAEDAQDTSQ